MYVEGKIYPPNECDIFEGLVDFKDETGNTWFSKVVVYGNSKREVQDMQTACVQALNNKGEDSPEIPNYAAAFNKWMDSYMSNPSVYKDTHQSAIDHLKQRLNGEEPSYGAVCQEIFMQYLEETK